MLLLWGLYLIFLNPSLWAIAQNRRNQNIGTRRRIEHWSDIALTYKSISGQIPNHSRDMLTLRSSDCNLRGFTCNKTLLERLLGRRYVRCILACRLVQSSVIWSLKKNDLLRVTLYMFWRDRALSRIPVRKMKPLYCKKVFTGFQYKKLSPALYSTTSIPTGKSFQILAHGNHKH